MASEKLRESCIASFTKRIEGSEYCGPRDLEYTFKSKVSQHDLLELWNF